VQAPPQQHRGGDALNAMEDVDQHRRQQTVQSDQYDGYDQQQNDQYDQYNEDKRLGAAPKLVSGPRRRRAPSHLHNEVIKGQTYLIVDDDDEGKQVEAAALTLLSGKVYF
jgi:hypothetical protein